ncbi:MAG: polysaccharide biosynthesis protein [Bacteroidetes bacterium]|nr:MAG: polysaccharide biosynthesis protein [Bacteroidota bacterium]
MVINRLEKRFKLIFFKNKYAPRWFVFTSDLFVCLLSICIAFLLRFNAEIPEKYTNIFLYIVLIVVGLRGLAFYLTKTYTSIVRHTGIRDTMRLFLAVTGSTLMIAFFNFVHYYFHHTFFIPLGVIIIDYITTMFLLTSTKVLVKVLFQELPDRKTERTNVIIYGAGQSGLVTKRTLEKDRGTKYRVICFVDDDTSKRGKRIEGVRVSNVKRDLEELLENYEIHQLIISIQNIATKRKKEIIEYCLSRNIKVLNVPPITTWINGELSFKQLKKVKITDLLEREPIQLDRAKIKQQLSRKTVLITGAAGSIGSGLVKEIANFYPKKIVLLDQAESALYDLELNLTEKKTRANFEVVIGDIRNKERMEHVFSTFKPDFVYHAAAYKHVPIMENNPSESLITNVMGTKIIADLAVRYKVEKFVMVSTDKAVNPTNVMGASKRIAEIYIQSLNKKAPTKFITTRFGNVLNSSGSVIPRFRKQIEDGGPITVTHPKINRFFMTIPEACQLVLEAGAMGSGGEIFLFDMGDSVKIVDLAKKMIKLSGLTLGKDIQLVFTGLRPGEKLYEELLNDQENTSPTYHSKIMIGKVREYNFQIVSREVELLIGLCYQHDHLITVRKMKEIVPEFVSQNSIYESLDQVTNVSQSTEAKVISIKKKA